MNVFVLNTGRCGSRTLFHALNGRIPDYTVGHETRADRVEGRLDYPPNHIEIDNRLWFFAYCLRAQYPESCFGWLQRDMRQVIGSFARTSFSGEHGVLRGWSTHVIRGRAPLLLADRMRVAESYVTAASHAVDGFWSGLPRIRQVGCVWVDDAATHRPWVMRLRELLDVDVDVDGVCVALRERWSDRGRISG